MIRFMEERETLFHDLNDRIWGKGHWFLCHDCLDAMGEPLFHHWKDYVE